MDVLTRPIINETKRAFNGRLVEERELKEKSWQEKWTRRDAVAASTERKSGRRGDVDILSRRSDTVNSKLTATATIVKARDNINAPIFIPEYKPSSTMDGTARPAAVDISQHPSKQHVYARAVGGGIMVPSMRQGSLPTEVSDYDDDDEAGVDVDVDNTYAFYRTYCYRYTSYLDLYTSYLDRYTSYPAVSYSVIVLYCTSYSDRYTSYSDLTHPSLTVTHPFIYNAGPGPPHHSCECNHCPDLHGAGAGSSTEDEEVHPLIESR